MRKDFGFKYVWLDKGVLPKALRTGPEDGALALGPRAAEPSYRPPPPSRGNMAGRQGEDYDTTDCNLNTPWNA